MKKVVIIALCVILTVVALVCFNWPARKSGSIESLHINSSVIRLESDMSKRLSIVVYSDKKDNKNYKLVSENEFVAVCDGDSVNAVNEGETYVYAKSSDGKVESNRVKVIVSNDIFATAAKVIMLANDEQYYNKTVSEEVASHNEKLTSDEKESVKDIEITQDKAEQIVETEVANVSEKTEVSTDTTENAHDTVYVTKSGGRFHQSNCASAKNSTPIPRSEAISEGKTPCQKCNP